MENAVWHPVTIGHSDAQTFRLEAEDGTSTYLKRMKRGGRQSLKPEAERLSWLQGKLPVPRLLDYREHGEHELLWISELPGRHAAERSWAEEVRRAELVSALAAGLRQIHSVPIGDCPFDRRIAACVREAEQHMMRGWVDETDFDESRSGLTAGQLFEQLQRSLPHAEELVFTHGDYCMPNIIVDAGFRCGFIDLGRAGVADRYQDIALAVRSLIFNFGEQWVELFLRSYGLPDPDWSKIEFYKLLDEFF